MSAHLKNTVACAVVAASLALSVGFASAKRRHAPHERGTAPKQTQFVCTAPSEFLRLSHSLKRVTQKVDDKRPITIVAIGSSSTFGSGASSPDLSYPSRLAVELQTLFPGSPVTVLNRGVGGETTADMLARFDNDVFAAMPDLVLWQVGSNSVLQRLPAGPAAVLVREGLDRLKADGADVIVIDPQYAPAIVNNDVGPMLEAIAAATRDADVNLFERFAVMRHWRLAQNMPYSAFVTEDELHMNDWGYGCFAKLLAGAITDATTRATVTATAQPRRPTPLN